MSSHGQRSLFACNAALMLVSACGGGSSPAPAPAPTPAPAPPPPPAGAAVITSVGPADVDTGGRIIVLGRGLQSAVSLRVGSLPATAVAAREQGSYVEVTANAPTTATSGPVSITLQDGRTVTSVTSLRVVAPAPKPMTKLADQRYLSPVPGGVDPDLVSLDLYYAAGFSGRPVLVFVHGGTLFSGDKGGAISNAQAQGLVNAGFVVASVNYRLTPEAAFPRHVQDVAAALAWVKANASRYGGEPRRLFVAGHSAGAYLAALVSTDPAYLSEVGMDLRDNAGTIALDTEIYDIASGAGTDGRLPPAGPSTCSAALRGTAQLQCGYGDTFGSTDAQGRWAGWSPQKVLRPGTGVPPFFVAYTKGGTNNQCQVAAATDNRVRRREHAVGMVDAVSRSGSQAEVFDAARLDYDHDDIVCRFGVRGEPVTEAALTFIRQQSSFNRMQFAPDLPVGSFDANGRFLGGTELTYLTPHAGMLFAGVGYWKDTVPVGNDPQPPAQVLIKSAAVAPWQVDFEFPARGRVSLLKSVTFATDCGARALNPAVSMLVASPDGSDRAALWTRNGNAAANGGPAGGWAESLVFVDTARTGDAYARSSTLHRDSVTGVDSLFAGMASGAVYRGCYDASAPGRLRWSSTPEITGSERVHPSVIANGRLYVAIGSNNNPNDRIGGLYRRVDGATPSWEFVYEWPTNATGGGPGLRGLTAVPDPLGGSHQVLIGTLEDRGVVIRIDPLRGDRVVDELDFSALFTSAWGSLGGRATLAGYNELLPIRDPYTSADVHLVGLWVNHPSRATSGFNGSYYLIRNRDATYTWANVLPAADRATILPDGRELRATRTIAPSPFPTESPRRLYFEGFDAGGAATQHNTAWLYRGELR